MGAALLGSAVIGAGASAIGASKSSKAINKATGAALLWVHHKNAAGDRERGHTSLRANIDTAIEVTKDEETNIRTARLVKLKDGEDGRRYRVASNGAWFAVGPPQ